MPPGVGHQREDHLVAEEAQEHRAARLVEGAGAADHSRAIATGSQDTMAQPDGLEGVAAARFDDYPISSETTFAQQIGDHFRFGRSILPDAAGSEQHCCGMSLCPCKRAFYPMQQRFTGLTIGFNRGTEDDHIVAQRLRSLCRCRIVTWQRHGRGCGSIAPDLNLVLYVCDGPTGSGKLVSLRL